MSPGRLQTKAMPGILPYIKTQIVKFLEVVQLAASVNKAGAEQIPRDDRRHSAQGGLDGLTRS